MTTGGNKLRSSPSTEAALVVMELKMDLLRDMDLSSPCGSTEQLVADCRRGLSGESSPATRNPVRQFSVCNFRKEYNT